MNLTPNELETLHLFLTRSAIGTVIFLSVVLVPWLLYALKLGIKGPRSQ